MVPSRVQTSHNMPRSYLQPFWHCRPLPVNALVSMSAYAETTAVCYINNMGGTHSQKLVEIASQMWEWSLKKETLLSAHLPGRLNYEADQESRRKTNSSKWMLDPAIFPEGDAGSWTMSGGPLCIQALSTAEDLHELETRSRGGGN